MLARLRIVLVDSEGSFVIRILIGVQSHRYCSDRKKAVAETDENKLFTNERGNGHQQATVAFSHHAMLTKSIIVEFVLRDYS